MNGNPSDLDLCYVEAATDLPGPAWETLIGPEDFFLSPPWLQVAQATAGVPMRYLLARHEDTLVGGLATALADETAPWVFGRPDTLLARCESEGWSGAAGCRRQLPDADPAALLPSLVCGGRHLGRTRAVYAPQRGVRVLTELVAQAETTGRSLGAASVAFQFVDSGDRALRSVLTDRGYLCHVSGHYSWLPLPPGGFPGYLAQLSAHRRRRVLAERRHIADSGVDTSIEPLTAAAVPRLAELETRLNRKYGLAHWYPDLSERAFHHILAVMPGHAMVCISRAAGDIRGFVILLRFRDTWYAHRAGFDYAYQAKLPLYFETLYYHPIEVAADHGVATIHYGMGSEGTKRSRGCLTSEQQSYVRMIEAP